MRPLLVTIALAVVCMAGAPGAASAASVATDIAVGSIDVSSLLSASATPTLSGLAFGVRTVQLTLYRPGTNTAVYVSEPIAVYNDRWEAKISAALSDGSYDAKLANAGGGPAFIFVPQGVLTVSKNAGNTTLKVAPVPLLRGGTARGGAVVPLSYLQVTNTGSQQGVLKGFRIQENGSAPAQSILALLVINDRGALVGFSAAGPSGSALFMDNAALAPANATFAPGQLQLFTIKALLASSVSAYAGTQLMVDVASVDAAGQVDGAFPIRGTTWTLAN